VTTDPADQSTAPTVEQLVECPTCGNHVGTTKVGRMRKHAATFTTIRCPASGRKPKPDRTVARPATEGH
jgi:hypothetical protein